MKQSKDICDLIGIAASAYAGTTNELYVVAPLSGFPRAFRLTYLLTAWSTVLEKLTGSQPVKFPTFYGTRRFITPLTRARHLFLSSASSIQSMPPTSHFLMIHLNIILPFMPGSPKWSLSLRFPHQKNPVYASSLPHTCYIPRPSHSLFDHPSNIG